MTKRFTPKASTYTERLAEVQAKQAKLRKQMAELDAEEQSLKAFLMPFYDEGKTEVTTLSGGLLVNFNTHTREYMNQSKAALMLGKLGKKVPTFTSEVITFQVKTQKG